MRSTVRIDDDLMAELKAKARQENVSLTRMLNRIVRTGLASSNQTVRKRPKYHEKAVSMGRPRINLDKSIALAAALEDEEVLRELLLRK